MERVKARLDWLGGSDHRQLIARLDPEVVDLPGSELKNAVGFETHLSDAPRGEALPGFQNTKILVESYYVNGEAHPHRVDAGGGTDEQPGAVINRGFSEKADQPGKKRVSEADARADGNGLLRNGDSQVLHVAASSAGLLDGLQLKDEGLPGARSS
jgi:hypothetical protein